ncbi:MAG: tetratricopeptide repeat protein [Candidatus Sericytochromatia bacterium]
MHRQRLLTSLLLLGLLSLSASPAWSQAASPAASELRTQGQNALKNGQYSEAISALEQHTRLQPEDLGALQDLAAAYLALKQLPLAEVTLNAAHKLERNATRTHWLRGQLRLAQGDYPRARSEFRSLIYLGQESAEVWYELARVALAAGSAGDLREALQKGQALSTALPDMRSRFLELQAETEPQRAEALLQEAASVPGLSRERQQALRERNMKRLLAEGKIRDVLNQHLQSLDQALQRASESEITSSLRQLEDVLARSQSPEEDRLFYQMALEERYERFPGQPLLRRQLIQMYQRQLQYENLLAFYRAELIRQRSSLSAEGMGKAFHRMADVHLKMGYLQFAFDNYARAVERDPRDFEAQKRMGAIYLSARDLGEARKRFEQVARENPIDLENTLMLALTYAYDKQDDRARQFLALVPPEIRPELRALITAVMASPERRPSETIWKQLIPEESIFSE